MMEIMRSSILCASVLSGAIFMASCSSQNSSPQAAAPRDGAISASVKGCASSGLYAPIPGFNLSIPVHMRSDKIYTKKDGEVRRGVMLEYLQGDADSALSAVAKAFGDMGYLSKGPPSTDGIGQIRQQFQKDGKGLFLGVSPEPGKSPANPEAKGTIWISWQLQAPDTLNK